MNTKTITEMDGLRSVTRDLSRIFQRRSVNEECDWKNEPKGWDKEYLGKWGNITGTKKDSRDLLLKKIDFLEKGIDQRDENRIDENLRKKIQFIRECKFKELTDYLLIERNLINIQQIERNLANCVGTKVPECANMWSQIILVAENIVRQKLTPSFCVESEETCPEKKRKLAQPSKNFKQGNRNSTSYRNILPKSHGKGQLTVVSVSQCSSTQQEEQDSAKCVSYDAVTVNSISNDVVKIPVTVTAVSQPQCINKDVIINLPPKVSPSTVSDRNICLPFPVPEVLPTFHHNSDFSTDGTSHILGSSESKEVTCSSLVKDDSSFSGISSRSPDSGILSPVSSHSISHLNSPDEISTFDIEIDELSKKILENLEYIDHSTIPDVSALEEYF